MNNNLFRNKYNILTALSTIGIVIGGVWYITKNNKNGFLNRKLNNEDIKSILMSISNELHPILMEFSHLVSSISSPTHNQSIEFLSNIEIIFSNGGFKDKVIDAQKHILDNWTIDEESFENLVCSACKIDEGVLMLKLGINKMYQDSLQGIYPLLPYLGLKTDFNVKYPKYTQDYILNILKELNNEKEKGFKKVVEEIGDPSEYTIKHPISGVVPSEELSKRLEEVNNQSEDIVFESLEHKRLFSHAIALYSREEEFVQEKKKIEKEHSDKILNIIINYDYQRTRIFGT